MTPVTITGMAAGTLLILTTAAVFWAKKDFPVGGLGVVLLGVILIGMSQWSSIKVNAGGNSVELLAFEKKLDSAVTATADLAVATRNAANSAETAKSQISELTTVLAQRNLVSPEASAKVQDAIKASPAADTVSIKASTQILDALRRSPKVMRVQPR
jgi:hypothetical protein